MRVSISTPSPVPNRSKIQNDLHIELAKLWRGAGRAFIRRVALEGIVKVDTGMSRGSLLPLSRAVGLLTAVRASITADRARRGGRRVKGKSIAAGVRAGENAFEYEVGTPAAPKFIFEFEIKVLQYLLNERGVNGNQAWDSLMEGRRAFLEHLDLHASEAIRQGFRGLSG